MLREFGLALFLASVGIKAGEHFVDTVVAGDGLTYVWTGFLITVIPILIIGVIARMRFKLNYFTIMGLIAGSTTDPPALAFANQASSTDAPAVGYSNMPDELSVRGISITSKSLKACPSTVKRTSVRTLCQPMIPAAPGLICSKPNFGSN